MDFGFVFFGDVNVAPDVALAEKRGFTHAWLYDSQMLASDVYAALALCAAKTKKIMLGPGVTNPASRIAPLTACSIASINAIAPGPIRGTRIEQVISNRAKEMGRTFEEVEREFVEPTALKRMAEEEDIAAMAVFLASEEGRNLTGETINISSGTRV